MKIKEYTLPAYWASYLINGDASGITCFEKQQIDNFVKKHKLKTCLSCSAEASFCWSNDADNFAGEVLTYYFPE